MQTRRRAHGRTVARNAHPRLRLPAAPLRQARDTAVRRATDTRRSADRRSVYVQFVQRLRLLVS